MTCRRIQGSGVMICCVETTFMSVCESVLYFI
jgi:hypothetical protein